MREEYRSHRTSETHWRGRTSEIDVAPVRFGDGETKRASSPGAKMPFIKPADWAVE